MIIWLRITFSNNVATAEVLEATLEFSKAFFYHPHSNLGENIR